MCFFVNNKEFKIIRIKNQKGIYKLYEFIWFVLYCDKCISK